MKPPVLTFVLFLLSQLLFWIFSMQERIIDTDEIIVTTFVVGFFMSLFYAGYLWARWITLVLMALAAILVASMTFEGFGFEFLLVTILLVITMVMVYTHQPVRGASSSPVKDVDAPIDMHLAARAKEETPVAIEYGRYTYPLLLRRYQSFFIDWSLLFATLVIAMVVMGESPSRQAVMISLGVLFGFVYEPFLTCFSATIGQRIMGIRVRSIDNPDERINLVQAYIRLVVKVAFGWLSFLTINFNPQHRAIHDTLGSSVVIQVR
jgi:uncharacterized RDD family membrane protein YckC